MSNIRSLNSLRNLTTCVEGVSRPLLAPNRDLVARSHHGKVNLSQKKNQCLINSIKTVCGVVYC